FPSRLQSADVAPAIATLLGYDLIASPPRSLPATQNPYVWLLVQPDGEQFLVDEVNPNAADLVMDEANRRPLNSVRA
ncbi:MAG TPA: hypothetical protein VHB97_02270, partial [Polyangia bacterium]|nr:hypothetical protein [Polyangia bacterium]